MDRVALLFPGQGAQSVGMGVELARDLPAARELFDRAAVVLGYDLADLCFRGPAEQLDATRYSQPALFVTSLAALEALRRDAPGAISGCVATAGLSLGEYTALVVAGGIEFEPALAVVAERAAAMQDAANSIPGGMVSILGLDLLQVEELCRRALELAGESSAVLQVANLLCPGNIVISGTRVACDKAVELAPVAGAMKAVPLAVAGAFHTSLMEPAVEPLAQALAAVEIRAPRIPVISNVDAEPHTDPVEIRELLVRQVVSPVRWEDSQRKLLAMGCDSFYEVGPGRVLRGLLRRIDRKIACAGVM